MPLPSSSRASVSKHSKEGSPPGVSLLTAEKSPGTHRVSEALSIFIDSQSIVDDLVQIDNAIEHTRIKKLKKIIEKSIIFSS